jgi:hypothetical protein
VPEEQGGGAPQSPTTGRWEILQEARRQAGSYPHRRWNEVPLWYRVLDRFGLPTLFVLLLCGAIGWTVKFVLTKWDEHELAVAAAMEHQAATTGQVAGEVHAMAADTHTQLGIMLDRIQRPGTKSPPPAKLVPPERKGIPLPPAQVTP